MRIGRWLGVVLVVTLALSGCGPAEDGQRLPNDGPAPAVSRTAAISFVRKALTAGQRAVATKQLTLVLTDAEVTSFLNIRAQIIGEIQSVGIDQLGQVEGLEGLAPEEVNIDVWRSLLEENGDGDGWLPRIRLGLREPAVYFKADGRVIFRGYVTLLRWRRAVRFVTAPHAQDGELVFDFVEGQIGRVKLPEALFDLLGKGLAKVLLAGQAYAEITEIRVEAGAMTLRGRAAE